MERTRIRLKLGRVAAVCVLCAVAGSCGGGQRPSEAAAVEARDIKVYPGDGVLHEVRGLISDGEGGVWALSGTEPFVYRYGSDGTLQAQFGRKGRGPGELLNPWALVPTGDPAAPIRIWDVANRRITTYSRSGEPVASRAVELSVGMVRGDIRHVTYGDAYKVRPFGGGLLVQDQPGGISNPVDLMRGRLLAADGDGRVRSTLMDFAQQLRPHASSMAGARALVPVPLWAVCPGGELAVLDPFERAVTWFDAAGRRLGANPVPVARADVTGDDITKYMVHVLGLEVRGSDVPPAQVEQMARQIASSERGQFGRTAPPAVDLLCTEGRTLWLNQFSTADNPIGYGREWVIVQDGAVQRRVRFPAGFRPLEIDGGTALGVFTDGNDVQSVAAVRLP